jgi:hypothetical protein
VFPAESAFAFVGILRMLRIEEESGRIPTHRRVLSLILLPLMSNEQADLRYVAPIPVQIDPASGKRGVVWILQRVVALNERLAVFVILAWAVLYAARPLYLGLYSDDWWALIEATHGSAPFSIERLSHFVGLSTNYAARPLAGFAAFLLSSVAGQSVLIYQICAGILVLAAALSLRAWFTILLTPDRTRHTLYADISAIFWLSLPWSLATTGWVVCAAGALPAQILFTEAARFAITKDRFDARRLWTLGGMLLASNLLYEAFYLQFILLAALYVASGRLRFEDRRQSRWFFAVILAAQAFSLAANRLIALFNPSGSKHFASNWGTLVKLSMQIMPGELKDTLGAAGGLWTMLILLLVATSLASLAFGLWRARERRANLMAPAVIAYCVLSILVSMCIFALASYRLTPVGFVGRTLVVVSLALSTAFFASVATAGVLRFRAVKALILMSAVSIITINSMALCGHVFDLALVWSKEKEILSRVPVDEFEKLPPESHVLYVGPSYYRDWAIFAASWELTGAVFSLPPLAVDRAAYEGLTNISPAGRNYDWTWDGVRVSQVGTGYDFPARHLFLMTYGDARLREVQKGFRRKVGAGSVVSGPAPGGGSVVGSVTHTNLDANAWWQVDLGFSAKIRSIKIWNRTDGSINRLSDYWVFVSDTPFSPAETPAGLQKRPGTWSNHQNAYPNPAATIAVGGARGKYVRVQLAGTNYLSLAEVQVLGAPVDNPSRESNLALGKAAAQSSTLGGFAGAGAEVAVDGNTDGNFTPASISVAPAARFVEEDAKTMGSWKGVYGTDGFVIAADSANYPGYAEVELAGGTVLTWARSTKIVRALDMSDGMDRSAAAWSSTSSLNINASLTDGKTHRISLYCLDWDEAGRTQVIEVLNASNGSLLESHRVTDFAAGQYLTFDITGRVTIRVTRIAGGSAVISGLFFQH